MFFISKQELFCLCIGASSCDINICCFSASFQGGELGRCEFRNHGIPAKQIRVDSGIGSLLLELSSNGFNSLGIGGTWSAATAQPLASTS